MCGIALRLHGLAGAKVSQPHASHDNAWHAIQQLLAKRGPDHMGSMEVQCGHALIQLVASLLQLRGSSAASCPLADPGTGSVLLYNGELFGGGVAVQAGQNDGQQLLAALVDASQSDHAGGVLRVLNSLRGPWTVAFWQPSTCTLWFGRDVMGRRSLLAQWPCLGGSGAGPTCLTLTSVAPPPPPPSRQHHGSDPVAPPAPAASSGHQGEAAPAAVPPPGSTQAGPDGDGEEGGGEAAGSAVLFGPGACAPGRRWQEVPPGVYSLVLGGPGADLGATGGSVIHDSQAHGGGQEDGARWVLSSHPWQDPELQAIAEYERPDHLVCPPDSDAHQDSSTDGETAVPQQPDTDSQVPASAGQRAGLQGKQGSKGSSTVAGALRQAAAKGAKGAPLHPGPSPDAVSLVLGALRAAVQVRCACIEDHLPAAGARTSSSAGTTPSQPGSPPVTPAPIVILFSGGVDSTLIAALAHQCLPPHVPIDLSNVCFDGGRSPDRLAARSALAELAAYAPGRAWRLVEVDRTLADVDAHKDHILNLLHPAGTVMDLNIGAALWLAVGASGTLRLPPPQTQLGEAGAAAPQQPAANQRLTDGQPYTSAARVVMLGHGADEQCAGYGRHRTRFVGGGWRGLSGELRVDVRRLWVRNLGRDDRLVSDWGREARHPFLAEPLMRALLGGVALREVADLRNAPGVGDKHVLRAALAQLGLPEAAARVKRAIQFGSRIGKASNVREFGSNRAANRRNAGSVALEALAIT